MQTANEPGRKVPTQAAANTDSVAHEPYAPAEQLPLRLPPPIIDALYFAVLPDGTARGTISDVGQSCYRQFGSWGQPYLPDRLHLSLLGMGYFDQYSEAGIAAVVEAAGSVRFRPFEVTFDRLMRFGRGETGPLVLLCADGTEPLTALQVAICSAMLNAGLKPPRQPRLNPHITLLYGCNRMPETILDHPITWTVREFVLIHGLHGQGRHEHVGKWGLRS
jgi:2'-5' RNA ligase